MVSPAQLGQNFRIRPGADPNEVKTCPNSLTRLLSAPLEHRSLCPYYHDVLQLPAGYYPPSLEWAKCKCTRCVENGAYGCEMVMSKVAVLRPAGCLEGMQQYEEQLVDVSTGCACAFKAANADNEPAPTLPSGINWAC